MIENEKHLENERFFNQIAATDCQHKMKEIANSPKTYPFHKELNDGKEEKVFSLLFLTSV